VTQVAYPAQGLSVTVSPALFSEALARWCCSVTACVVGGFASGARMVAAGGHVGVSCLLMSSWHYKRCLQCIRALCSCLIWCSHVQYMRQAAPLSCAVMALNPVSGRSCCGPVWPRVALFNFLRDACIYIMLGAVCCTALGNCGVL
jgi:hypothetical protein